MIVDDFKLKGWKITILYECSCEDIDFIIDILRDINCPNKYIKEALDNLEQCKLDSGLTYSNIQLRSSVIVIFNTSSKGQLVNTISHEYFHLVCHIQKAYDIMNEEELADLNGNLNMKSFNFLKKLL